MSAPGLTPQLKAFNEELAGICSESPPISRSKMKAITTSGMKAIKMYKHVVQNVEKFISKSKPTYKVTGLYVIDALIRKSQAEFGPDKDVYAKRFQKNMLITFQHLAKSAISNEDKEKCKKIITLWRRGKTYEESLLDELDSIMLKSSNSVKSESIASKNEPNPPADDAEVLISTILSNPESEMAQNLAKMLGGPQQEQLQQILSKMKNNQPETQTEPIQDKSPLIDEVDRNSWQQPPPPLPPSHGKSIPISTIPPPNDWHQHPPPPHPLLPPPGAWEHPPPPRLPSPRHDRDHSRDRRRSRSPRRDFSPRRDRSRSRDRDSRRRRRSRTRSRSRDRDRKRSRSRDRDHRRDRYRRRSRSRERRSSRRDEISNREKMCLPSTKEGKGCVASRTIWIGNISKGDCTEESVRNMIKNVDRADDIEDITALHSRGCAYVVMKTRAAAFKTLQKLASKRGREEKRKVDWAINSGLKDAEMQAYFDKAEGAAFIEYSKLPEDIEVLIKWARGGVIDIESMPEKVQAAIAAKDRENSQSVDMEMDMDEKDPTSQVVGNATNLPMVGGMPTMTIPMGMPMPGQIPSGQIPLATPMGQHPLQGTPMMMGHQGLILPQGGVLPQGAAPRAPMMGFIPRERFPGPGGFGPRPPGGPGGMPDNHWNGPPGHSMGGPRHRGERFQSPRGRFPDDRGFDGGRGGPRGGHGSWNRGPPRQNFNDRDHRRDHQGDHRRDNRGDWPDRWGNAGGHQRGDRHRNDRSPNRDRGFSRLSPNPSHEHNPWGGRNTNGQGWQPHEIKQEKNNEQHTNNEENAQTNGWQSNEPKDAEEKTQPVPSDESKTNESNPPLHMIKSERTDPIQTDPPNESENTANTPIHDEPNTNDATSSAAAIQPVSGAADPGLEKSIYDPDSLLNSTVSSGVGEGTGEPSTAESTDDNRAQSTAISSPGND